MNLPLKLPPRAGFPESYRYDSPITELGAMTSQMIGRGFTANKLSNAYVITSPGLRCAQTASNIIKAMDNKLRMGVETALFDFPGWYEQVPIWMDDTEMNSIGLPVDGNYTPVESRDAIHDHKSESYIDFQKRVATNINTLLDRQKGKTYSTGGSRV
jgi:broad specificity phosphatase PhoE